MIRDNCSKARSDRETYFKPVSIILQHGMLHNFVEGTHIQWTLLGLLLDHRLFLALWRGHLTGHFRLRDATMAELAA